MKYLAHRHFIGHRKRIGDILGYVGLSGRLRQNTNNPRLWHSTVKVGGSRIKLRGTTEGVQDFIQAGTIKARFPDRDYEHAGDFFMSFLSRSGTMSYLSHRSRLPLSRLKTMARFRLMSQSASYKRCTPFHEQVPAK